MKSIIFLLVVLGCLNVARSLECYECNTRNKADCGDPFKKEIFANSTAIVGEGGVCRKTKGSVGGVSVVDRGRVESVGVASCLGGKTSCKTHEVNGESSTVCCCTTDFCNGASMIGQQTFVLFAVLSAVLMIVNRWY